MLKLINNESRVFTVRESACETVNVFFRRDIRRGNIYLADAECGEPVLSKTNQYLTFSSLKEATLFLDKIITR